MFSVAGLLTLAALASVGQADDNAISVGTLDFKNAFVESGIVPEVIAALDPAVSFYVTYRAADGHEELLLPGSNLTVSEAQAPLDFSVENLNNATNITAQTRYLIYLLDADAPSRDDPSARNLRHYLAGNYTVSNLNSTVLPTAQRLVIQANSLRPFTNFTEPNPMPNTGVHRFIYALYTQPARFNTAGFESVGMESETANWNLSRWRSQLGLGPAIGATFFTIDTSANANTQGSENRPGTGAGGGPGSAAASISVSTLTTGLTIGAVLLGLNVMF